MVAVARKHLVLIWLAAISLAVGYIAWVQAAAERKVTRFAEIDVQRINIREPNGTLRMVISNTAAAPGSPWRGKEIPRPDRRIAGILFMNDEGTETGGLVFSGKNENGKNTAGVSMTFDQYEQDQVIALATNEYGGQRRAGLTFSDRPDTPLRFDLIDRGNTPEGQAEIQKLANSGGFGYDRLFIGKTKERDSTVILRDAKGRARLIMKVTPAGAASIEFLDEAGKVVNRISE
jgi:hypothetical protein